MGDSLVKRPNRQTSTAVSRQREHCPRVTERRAPRRASAAGSIRRAPASRARSNGVKPMDAARPQRVDFARATIRCALHDFALGAFASRLEWNCGR